MTTVADGRAQEVADLPAEARQALPRPGLTALRGRRGQVLSLFVAISALAVSVGIGTASSLALFTDSTDTTAVLGTKAIFPGERVTPAFSVADSSAGGSSVDRSSAFAFSGDGLTVTTSPFTSAFSSGRYVDFDMNDSLPGGLAALGADVELRFASAGTSSTACYYLEVRRISTGALLDTYGSSGSPLDCVTGTSPMLSTTAIDATVASTDDLNDLRIRILGADSGSNGMIVDRATVSGTTALATFTLYPVRDTDAADGTPVTTVWELAGP